MLCRTSFSYVLLRLIGKHDRIRTAPYQISVSRGDAEYCVTLDGVLLPDDRIPLKDDGQNHTVEIIQN